MNITKFTTNSPKKILDVRATFPWKPICTNVIMFCYPQYGTPFIVKGNCPESLAWINNNLFSFGPCVIFAENYLSGGKLIKETFVMGLKKEYSVSFNSAKGLLATKNIARRNIRSYINIYQTHLSGKVISSIKVRRFHRGWIKELDPYVIPFATLNNAVRQEKIVVPPLTPVELTVEEKQKLEEKRIRDEAIANSRNLTLNIMKEMGVRI